MKYLSTVKLKSTAKAGCIEGYASVFDVCDRNGDIVTKKAFQKSIDEFRSGKKPKLLWQHNLAEPIGVIDEMFEDDHGLFLRAHLLLDIPRANEVYLLLKNRAIDGLSIGYRVRDQYRENGANYLTDIDLLEVSIVTLPACVSALVEDVKSLAALEEATSNEKNLNANAVDTKNSGERPMNSSPRGTLTEKNLLTYINTKENIMQTLPLSDSNPVDFDSFIRSGDTAFLKKSLSEASDKEGGFLLPQKILMQVQDRLRYLSPMRTIAKTMTISSNSVDVVFNSELPDAAWAEGNEERAETQTPDLLKIKIPVHELYSRPKADPKLLNDSQVNIEEWLINRIAEKFAQLEDDAFINGDGTNKPKGFLSYARNLNESEVNKLQVFYTGKNGGFVDSGSAVDILVDITCSLKPNYIRNAKWLMSRSALAAIRKLKNQEGINIWQPAVSESTPSTLLGYPVIIDDNMPEVKAETDTTPIAFGDFYSGYQIVDRQNISILRDPYTAKPFVEFYVSKRVGGAVVDFDAVKLLSFKE